MSSSNIFQHIKFTSDFNMNGTRWFMNVAMTSFAYEQPILDFQCNFRVNN